MKKIITGITAAVLGLCMQTSAQKTVPYFGTINWINGYEKEISGENIQYYSAFPDYATTALLTRTTDGNKTIEWQTGKVPANSKGQYVYFSWVAGHSTGTSSGPRNFDLYVNNRKTLTFTTLPGNQSPVWSYAAADSSRIVFQQTARDGASDAHGLMFLRIPVSVTTPGKPVTLRITGQAQQSNDWFMTFKFAFQEKVDLLPQPFLLKGGKQPIALTALHFGTPETLQVKVNNLQVATYNIKDGINRFDIPVTAVKQKDSVHIVVSNGKKVVADKFVTLLPVTYRELDLIHHSHTDIGYSHMQPEVLKIHLKNIDDALQMIAATRNYPVEARFKWNIESLWAVENYMLQASPEKKAAFIKAVKEGSICLSALYANILTGLSLPEELFHYTDYANQLKKEYGLQIPSAMISDVPGYTWTTVTALAHGGVKYFSSGPNYLGENHPYLGDRVGHFVRTWGDKPVWWASPSGEEKILLWTGGKGYSSWHGTAPGGVFDRGPQKIATYLRELDAKKYPYDIVQWRYNIVADNGPIDTAISRFVMEWNEKYQSPKLVLNTVDKLFKTFEDRYGKQLPVVKGDITPYWEDGAASTAAESGKNRVNSLRLQQLTNAWAVLQPGTFPQQDFYRAWTNVIMFHEHTWGAHNSISQPDVPFVTGQWRIKKQFMLDADSITGQLESALLKSFTDNNSKRIAVVNTLSWARTGMVKIKVPGKSVIDSKGKAWPLQQLQSGEYVFMAREVPPLGTAVYEVSDKPVKATSVFKQSGNTISNGIITVSWDANTGSITSLSAKDQYNYAGTFGNQGLNSYWYVPGMDPAKAESNSGITAQVLENGPVVTTISLTGNAPGANSINKKITLYADAGEALIENIVDKKPVREKEAVHFGFPFNISNPKTTLDAGYGTLRYLDDQLPGSNMDFLFGRRWLDVSNNDRGIQWMLLETPMVEPQQMIDERKVIDQSHKEWRKTGTPTATWFNYIMNNYWHTNYKADQDGKSSYSYALRPHTGNTATAQEQAAAAFTQPLLAFPARKDLHLPENLFRISNTHIIITSVTPLDNNRYQVRLFNPESSRQQGRFVWGSFTGKDMEVDLPGMGVKEVIVSK
ncbi:Glycosyl hydrolases family 38 N-terminal domain-containing protein [Chitinophaga jiangningensis]|uniref:Glycosyl hydrolases family 38 N-terminal domain-containing protein n=1 Tax=Chitinophaga jiangningensis TaxID=1419482 RepID=A0A1M7F7X4_9BACT|nr:glycoside hydrolase family 38 C-terminal domain-containing protein [Chitinophaga jiangningensis]SHL99809.1 Glycosyl hydrolases family 38 N-terminal domain-containing protein [Chitinophaga jiangningensis]